MSKILVYQGYAEQFRWREVDANRRTVTQSEAYFSQQEAIDAALDHDPNAELEIQPVTFANGQVVDNSPEDDEE